jgi:hypothetical protein
MRVRVCDAGLAALLDDEGSTDLAPLALEYAQKIIAAEARTEGLDGFSH